MREVESEDPSWSVFLERRLNPNDELMAQEAKMKDDEEAEQLEFDWYVEQQFVLKPSDQSEIDKCAAAQRWAIYI